MLPCILPGSDPTETELNIVRTAFRGLKTAPTRTNLQGQTVESMSQDALYKYMHASQWLVCTVLLCELSTCPTESASTFSTCVYALCPPSGFTFTSASYE